MESHRQYPRLRTHFLDLLARKELSVVTSWITFAEVLVKPIQTGNIVAEAGYRSFFVPAPHFEILSVDQDIADKAAILRATHSFKLPDAIHIATGIAAGCTCYLTGDAQWSRAGINVIEATQL